MRILANALSVGSLSGRHVLYGHLRQLAEFDGAGHSIVVVGQAGEPCPPLLRRPNVAWMHAPAACRHWIIRSIWEAQQMPSLIQQQRADVYFTPNGTILPRCEVPQVSLAQNPWCLVPEIHRGKGERLKARLQRRAYRRAYVGAALMAYNSEYMRHLYRSNAPSMHEGDHVIAHQGIDDDTHGRAEAARRRVDKRPHTILCVSVMAHWKNIETILDALALLRARGVPAHLSLVGPWPDQEYAGFVRSRIQVLGLGSSVEVTGEVSRDELHRRYAEASVFCLMSRCESFGIPAVEAQAFGTPVVGASSGAMREICARGGAFCDPGNTHQVADLLQALLTEQRLWNDLSADAVRNASRYRWDVCSRPLTAMFDLATRTPSVAAVPAAS